MSKYLAPEKIVDVDDRYANVTAAVAASATVPTQTEILNLQTKPGKAGFLYFLGNAVQAGGETFITFRLYINGALFYPYNGSKNQWADPNSNIPLPVQYEIPASSKISIVAENSDTANTYDSTARLRVAYADFENISAF